MAATGPLLSLSALIDDTYDRRLTHDLDSPPAEEWPTSTKHLRHREYRRRLTKIDTRSILPDTQATITCVIPENSMNAMAIEAR